MNRMIDFEGMKSHWALLPVLLALCLPSPSLWASDSGSATNDSTKKKSGADVCADIKKYKSTDSADVYTQRKEYCKAARSAEEAKNANSKIAMVWTGVAGVCTAACAANLFGKIAGLAYVCTGANVVGGVTDAVITKEFTGALTAIAGVGGGLLANKFLGGGEAASKGTEAAKNAKSKAAGSCLQAATAGVSALLKNKAAKDAGNSAKENYANAAALTNGSESVGYGGLQGSGGNTTDLTATKLAGSTSISSPMDQGKDVREGGPCSGSGAAAAISCATASDQSLPKFVRDPKFLKELEEATGMSADNFFKQEAGAGTLGSTMSAPLGPAATSKLAAAIKNVDSKLQDTAYATYTGGGGAGGRGGGDSSDLNLQGMVSGLMNQLNPQDGQEGMNGLSMVDFANRQRSPASIAEDRNLSIFDRVAYRYRATCNRLEQLDWALPENRAMGRR